MASDKHLSRATSSGSIYSRSAAVVFFAAYIAAAVYFLTYHSGYYTYDSALKSVDLANCKLWLLFSLAAGIVIQLSRYKRSTRIWLWVALISCYFLVLYALLYKGTDFGYGGQWGDNSNRLALVEKFRDLPSIFQDWYNKGLPSFYPPLWFFVSGKLAALFDIPAYQTIKDGYFVIYAIYPAALYFVWSRLVRPTPAFLIVFLTIFLRSLYFDFVYYEYIAAAFFVPWWLYYVEDVRGRVAGRPIRTAIGGLLGALIFMTFYYWFFIGILILVLRPAASLLIGGRDRLRTSSVSHKLRVAGWLVLFSSIYWLPLLVSVLRFGFDSMQNKWFHFNEMNYPNEFYAFTLSSLIWLLGAGYLAARRRSRIARTMIFALIGVAALYFIERVLNNFDSAIQTRKLSALLPVFLAVPSGLALAFLYGAVRRRSRAGRRVLLALFALAIVYWGNDQSDIREDRYYHYAIDDYVRDYELAVFRAVDYRGRVFLTNKYTQAIYYPYYLFVTHYAPTAHPASRFDERVAFLKYVARLTDPARVAYLLRNNKFDTVDYFYLPRNTARQIAYFDLTPIYFPAETPKMTIEFPFSTTCRSPYFTLARGELYTVTAPDTAVRTLFAESDPAEPLDRLVRDYNETAMAVHFLRPRQADSLRSTLTSLSTALDDSLGVHPICSFERDVSLEALSVAPDPGTDSTRLRVLLRVGTRLREDLRLFVHVYPESPDQLPPDRRRAGFLNPDFRPGLRSAEVIAGEAVLFDKSLALSPGKYMFHVGLFNDESGRLEPTYRSEWFEVLAPGSRPAKSTDD